MIYIVNAQNRGLFHADLAAMHRHRKVTFVDRLGWRVPVIADEEIDAYDGDATLYLIARTNDVAPVLGSARLLPTSGPHLMSDLFASTCVDGPPRGRNVWEASRFCAMPTLRRRERLDVLWQVFCGIMETALLHDIEQVIFTANSALLPLALECGWQSRRLGPTLADGADTMTAIGVDIELTGLRTLRRRFRIDSPITRLISPFQIAA
ncbi:acyl-homoserine-lactone synthase [Povalibacter sp.]|uniref:acyl-homoserine-lactone synthase n=1 Tax=Povalibacter sp. TaxID=1962978 RepID=UPI002F3FE2ED